MKDYPLEYKTYRFAGTYCREVLTFLCPNNTPIVYCDIEGRKNAGDIDTSLLDHLGIRYSVINTGTKYGYGIKLGRRGHRVGASFNLLIARITINNKGKDLVNCFYNNPNSLREASLINSYYGWVLFKQLNKGQYKETLSGYRENGPRNFLHYGKPHFHKEIHPLFDKAYELAEKALSNNKITPWDGK